MKKALDVKHINPFLQSSVSVIEMTTQTKLEVGKPELSALEFHDNIFILQVGVTGVLRGQVLLTMNEENAKEIASKMMMGMPIEALDEMSRSALGELSNMIMGNAATLFSSQGIAMDITPPISLFGDNIKLQIDIPALKIPLMENGKEKIGIFLCVTQD
ncbi:MAG: chemotaxis protein CheX [Lachnospiraceae bacterium]